MPVLVAGPVDVPNRLEQLGWNVDDLLEVVGSMVAARNGCTENDPLSAPGWMAWKEGTRRMREVGRPKGLVKDDSDQVPSLLDAERNLRFLVSNTDDVTGIEHPYFQPQNRSKRGPATERAVAINNGSLFDYMDAPVVVPISRVHRGAGGFISWYLCVYHNGDEVRAELSCPVAVENGFFADFRERIILIGPDGPAGGSIRRFGPDDNESGGPEFDIPVVRK